MENSNDVQNTTNVGNEVLADVSERFCSADEYVKYMDNQGYTFKDDYDISQPMNTYPSDFRREYFRREWYRIKTMKKLIKRIEVLEGILNAR